MDESELDENRIGRKQDWTKKVGRKQVGRKLGARVISHQNLSDYIQLLFKKRFKFNKKRIISSEKMRNSGNYYPNYAQLFFENIFIPSRLTVIYNYAHSFFGEDF